MSLAEEIIAANEIGRPVFERLFAMNKADLIERLEFILGDKPQALEVLQRHNVVKKLTRDDEPVHIEIGSYSSVDVYPTGISFTPEHGAPVRLINFTKDFVLP